jgi:hypothetical protein
MLVTLFSAIVVLLVTGVTQAPNEPDFSGEWVLVKASGTSSNPAPALTVRQTVTRTTRRGGPMKPHFSEIKIERHFDSGVVAESYKIGLVRGTVGGIPPGASSPAGARAVVAVTWEGNNLIIRTGKYSGPPEQPGPYTEHEETWSLDANGLLLITSTDQSSGSGRATVTVLYERR